MSEARYTADIERPGMLHGRLVHAGPPSTIADELAGAYLGGDFHEHTGESR